MCVPVKRHYKCNSCNRYFSKTIGDCIGPRELIVRCPYCSNTDVKSVQESAVIKGFSIILNVLKKK